VKSIDRTYRVRGNEVKLQELVDLSAVRSDERGALPLAPLDSVGPETARQVHAFQDAGWEFVPREQAAQGAKVYVRPGGGVALGTDRLTVRVASDRSAEEAAGLLDRHGFTVLDRLKFAPNLFVVRVPAGHDAVEAAQRLADSGEVEFAEPELIEYLPGR
jgi:Fervidolysin N-terminal prodomain